MLKIVKTSIVITTASLIFSGNVCADINDALQNIGTIVKADDKRELRKKMKHVQSNYRLKLKDYYTGVSCGGNSLIRTAMLNDAVETGTLMIKKMPKGALTSPEDDGKTVLTWASDNGLDDSLIVAALIDRI
jgi:predicted methyltransferase